MDTAQSTINKIIQDGSAALQGGINLFNDVFNPPNTGNNVSGTSNTAVPNTTSGATSGVTSQNTPLFNIGVTPDSQTAELLKLLPIALGIIILILLFRK